MEGFEVRLRGREAAGQEGEGPGDQVVAAGALGDGRQDAGDLAAVCRDEAGRRFQGGEFGQTCASRVAGAGQTSRRGRRGARRNAAGDPARSPRPRSRGPTRRAASGCRPRSVRAFARAPRSRASVPAYSDSRSAGMWLATRASAWSRW